MSQKTIIVRWSLLLLGVALLIWGICSGGYLSVFNKAVMLCYECMGIG